MLRASLYLSLVLLSIVQATPYNFARKFPALPGSDRVSKVVAEASQEECPEINPPVAVILPHESDCGSYYICESGVKILRECPDDLHFNRKKKVCDFHDRAGCTTEKGHAELAAPQSTGFPSPFCPVINGKNPIFFPHPTNCSVYYMCGNGLAYEFACPGDLHFNKRKKVCDYSWNAGC